MVANRPAPIPGGICTPALVGRDRQLELLRRAVADRPAVVLVEGEAGIGKSRIVHEFLASVDTDAHRFLMGTCRPHREQAPLAPVVEALRAAEETHRVRVSELALSGLAGALRPLFPEWAAQLPAAPEPLGDPAATRHRLFRALAELIDRMRATMLVLDDAQWADRGTLEFLLSLLSRQSVGAPNAGLSVVVVYRPDEVGPRSPLRQLSSRRLAGATQVRLSPAPLGVDETAAMVSSMLGGVEVSDQLVAYLHERTGGVPLAIEESVYLLGERAALAGTPGRVGGDLPEIQVPPTIRDSTLERLRRRSRAAQRVLEAAAVLAEPADESVLVAVAGLSGQQESAVNEAMATGLLREGQGRLRGRLQFRHVLPAIAIYEAIAGPQRRLLHRRAGHVLARQQRPPAAQLARHFRRSGNVARWAYWAERAADAAAAASDHGNAAALLERLPRLHALPRAVRVRLAAKLATNTLYQLAGDAGQTREVINTVRGVLRVPGVTARDRAKLRNLVGRLLNQRGEPAAAYAELARSIPRLRHSPFDMAHAMILLGWPRTSSWPAAVHLRWLRRAERVAAAGTISSVERLGMQVDRATALLQLGAKAGWDVAAALPTVATTSQEWMQLSRGSLNIGDAAMHWGHYQHARQLLVLALERSRHHQLELVEAAAVSTLAYLDWLTGQWDGLAARVPTLSETTDFAAYSHDAIVVAGLWTLAQGNVDHAEPALRWSLDQAGRYGWVTRELAPASALSRLRLAEGRVDAALALTEAPVQTLMRKQIWVWATDIVPARVAALLAAGRGSAAAQLVAAYQAGMRDQDAPAAQAALLVCQAMVQAARGQHRQAAVAYGAAARAWQALPRPYEALLARERGAHCRLAGVDPKRGLSELEEIGREFWSLGATGEAARIAGMLREHGVDVTQRWRRRGYGNQLSPREREVVELVAAGYTNRQVAHTLSRSPSTVAKQLSSAMRKLGVTSRTALAVRISGAAADPSASNGTSDR